MFSIVVPTINRVSELERLLESLRGQSHREFEIIIVDQNTDKRLDSLMCRFSDLPIKRLSCLPGVSRARNLGILASTGDIVAMPDDDCWYPDTLLISVNNWLNSHPEYDVLFTDVRNRHDDPMRPRWPPPAGPCTKANVLDCTIVLAGFFRRKVIETIGGFDENLGPGPDTVFKACEDSDFCIRSLLSEFRMWYEPDLWVYHSEFQSLERLKRVMYPYALASGYILRAHGFSWGFMTRRIGRSLGGVGLNVCRANLSMAYLYLVRSIGQFRGYVFGASCVKRHLMPRQQQSGPP